jgi:four helix bundle protein
MKKKQFHDELKETMDLFVNFIYDITENFPTKEQFGITSQIRRASISIILNYIEGYARQSKKTLKNFLEISYGSLKEVKYLLYFCWRRKYLSQESYNQGLTYSEKIGRMLWGTISKIE